MFWKKKRLKKSYSESLTEIAASLYTVIVSMLQDALSESYSSKELKDAATITVNILGHRPEDRPDPSLSRDKLGIALSHIKGLTMIKEATSLILLFDYFISDKVNTARYEEAKKIGGQDFENIYNLVDIDRTSTIKIRYIGAAMSNKLLEIASFDIRNAL
jgi:hypothetical protein